MKIEILDSKNFKIPKVGDLIHTHKGYKLITKVSTLQQYMALDIDSFEITKTYSSIEKLIEDYKNYKIVNCKLVIES